MAVAVASMSKEVIMLGGRPMQPEEAQLQAAAAGVAPVVAPLPYGHGAGGVGQLVTNALQTRGTSLWGVMASPAAPPFAAGVVEGLANHLVQAVAVLGQHSVLEMSFGHIPLAVFDITGQGAIQAALGPGVLGNGCFLFYLCLAKPVNKRLAPGTIVRATVQGNETRFAANGRVNVHSSKTIIAVSQATGPFVSNVRLRPPSAVPTRPAQDKSVMNRRDEEAIQLTSRIDQAAPNFEEAVAPVYTWLETHHPGKLLSKRGRDDMASFLELQWKRRRSTHTPYAAPRREWRLPFWQRRLLYVLLASPPEKRRIFWICSTPDSGKGTFVEYLADREGWIPDLFPNMVAESPGVLSVSSYFTNSEKLAQMYAKAHVQNTPPGVLTVDFPKCTTSFTKSHINGLELLANVGEPFAGARYDGHSHPNRSHTVVLSNMRPPPGLRERCVWLLEVDAIDAEPDWTFPFKPRDHANQAAAAVAASADRALPEADLAPVLGVPPPVVQPVAFGAGGIGVPAGAVVPPAGVVWHGCVMM
jgi:hypothetical protein